MTLVLEIEKKNSTLKKNFFNIATKNYIGLEEVQDSSPGFMD